MWAYYNLTFSRIKQIYKLKKLKKIIKNILLNLKHYVMVENTLIILCNN